MIKKGYNFENMDSSIPYHRIMNPFFPLTISVLEEKINLRDLIN